MTEVNPGGGTAIFNDSGWLQSQSFKTHSITASEGASAVDYLIYTVKYINLFWSEVFTAGFVRTTAT